MLKVLLPAICFGLLIAYVDSRPTWDDTGITALAIAISCAALGATAPERPWLWALAVGAWIPLYEIPTTRNFGSLLALVVAFIAAYIGMGVRKIVASSKSAHQTP